MSASTHPTRRLKFAVEGCFNGVWGDEANGVDDMAVVRVADFNRERSRVELGDDPTVRAIPQSARNRRVLVQGDLLIEKSGGGELQPVGNVVSFDDERPSVCSNFVARMPVAKDCESRFVAYVFRSLYEQGKNIPHIKQTSGIQNLDSESYLNEVAWLPERETQLHIANFLDDKTARIDALISEKERLSEVLQESLEECIERAVLAPSLSARTSRLKHVVRSISTGPFGSALHASEYVEGGISVINPAHIIQGEVIPDPAVSVDAATANRLSSYSLSVGDLVVGRRGEMGRCAVIRADGAGWLCGTGSLVVRPDTCLVLADYLQLVISSRASRDWLSLESVGSTMENLNEQILLRLPGYFPSLVEQEQRLRELRQSKAHHDALMAHVKEHLARLREYRSSLISAAVTGQLDVGSFEVENA